MPCLRLLSLLALLAAVRLAADPTAREPALALMQHRQWAEAQAVLEKAVGADPADAEAWHLLGRVALNRNQAEPAVAALEKATALAPARSEYQRLLGDAYGLSALKAGMFGKFGFAKKCKAAYEQAIALDPDNLDARWSLMEYCRQAPAIAGGGSELAYAQAEEIRKRDSHRGRLALATLYIGDKKAVEAFGLYDEALREKPDDYATLYQLGRLSAMTGQRLDEGLAQLRRCLALPQPPNQPGPAPINWRIGNLLEKKGDVPGARAAYQAAIQADPQFVQAIESLRKLNAAANASATSP